MRGDATRLLLLLGLGCGRSWVYDYEPGPPASGSATSAASSAASSVSSSASSSVAPSTTASSSLGGSSSSGTTHTRTASSIAVTSSSSSTATGGSTSSGSSSSSCPAVLCDSPPDCSYAIVSVDGGCPACVVSCGPSPFDGVWLGTLTSTGNSVREGWVAGGSDEETVQQQPNGTLAFAYANGFVIGCTVPWVPTGALANSTSALLEAGTTCQDWIGETWTFTSGSATLDASGCTMTEQFTAAITEPGYSGTGSVQNSETLEHLSCLDGGDGVLGSPCVGGGGPWSLDGGGAGGTTSPWANLDFTCFAGLSCLVGEASQPYPGTCGLPLTGQACLPNVGCQDGDACWSSDNQAPTCIPSCASSAECGSPTICLPAGGGSDGGVCMAVLCSAPGPCSVPAPNGGVLTGCCLLGGQPGDPSPPRIPTPWFCVLDAGC